MDHSLLEVPIWTAMIRNYIFNIMQMDVFLNVKPKKKYGKLSVIVIKKSFNFFLKLNIKKLK